MAHKTKLQARFEAAKGFLEYNPNQTFCLQVFWIVRSPTAAQEMMQSFSKCAAACARDTPTTVMYYFRISKDQRLADEYRKQVLMIGQHPHYAPIFKSLEMGLPKTAMELKLKNGGIDATPLLWGPDELIANHEEIDFNPIVIECTEVYLDSRAFFEHACSKDWMGSVAEITKPCRSLKASTLCVGNPTQYVWDSALESYLKAILLNGNDSKIKPGVFFREVSHANEECDFVFLLEIDVTVLENHLDALNSILSAIQEDLFSPLLLVIPTNSIYQVDGEIRVMMPFTCKAKLCSQNFPLLKNSCQTLSIRLIASDNKNLFDSIQRKQLAEAFMLENDIQAVTTYMDGNESDNSNMSAGYLLHPRFQNLVSDDTVDFKP